MTRKRRPSFDSSQLGFTFEAPKPVSMPAELAGLDAMIAAAVGTVLKEDTRSRHEIAGAMSALLAEEVSAMMLDAYASEARGNHNIPTHRALALVAVTGRFDVMDALVRRIGAALVIGEEIILTEMGNIDRQLAELKARQRMLATIAKPMKRGGH
ncbi:hypothetical protein [Blastomonas fulva]|uniref:hypothetical protein n=1 Tax=Blastomonas fulva TaxID=1550728 RepID=UPI0025A3290C|nr:hypothetical protein [Blastomonas fulva]MDM7928690.1 hypothetical protein [Blastomonas fulva]MDM7964476.1 hypothetical protein [Blastomonas fulva]